MDRRVQLKAELFDMQIIMAQIKQKMEIKLQELNKLNESNTKPVLPGDASKKAPDTNKIGR